MRQLVSHSWLLMGACWALVACGGDSKPAVDAWVGKTFLLDTPAISSSSWTKPSGVLTGAIGNYDVPQFLFGVEAGTGDDLAITLAPAQDGVQDECSPTTAAVTSRAAYPNSTIRVAALPIRIVSKDLTNPGQLVTTVYDANFKDILPGVDSATTSAFDWLLDFIETASFVWPGATAEQLCQVSASTGFPCETCPASGHPYCMLFEAVQIATKQISTPVKKITSGAVPASCSSQP